MKIKATQALLGALVLFLGLSMLFTPKVLAQADITNEQVDNPNLLCELFPFLQSLGFANDALCTGEAGEAGETVSTVESLVRFGLSLVFVGIIAVAIFTIIKAALMYIRSEGNEDQVENAKKAIKSVFIGIGALLVGIIGLVLILAFFNATSAVQDADQQDKETVRELLQ